MDNSNKKRGTCLKSTLLTLNRITGIIFGIFVINVFDGAR